MGVPWVWLKYTHADVQTIGFLNFSLRQNWKSDSWMVAWGHIEFRFRRYGNPEDFALSLVPQCVFLFWIVIWIFDVLSRTLVLQLIFSVIKSIANHKQDALHLRWVSSVSAPADHRLKLLFRVKLLDPKNIKRQYYIAMLSRLLLFSRKCFRNKIPTSHFCYFGVIRNDFQFFHLLGNLIQIPYLPLISLILPVSDKQQNHLNVVQLKVTVCFLL